jgi:hypothetical protein
MTYRVNTMRWGENKNVHPRPGTDDESVVPPNLGRMHKVRTSLIEYNHYRYTRLYNGSNPARLLWAMDDRQWTIDHLALRLGGPFDIEVSRRLLSTTNLLSGAALDAYSSSSLPCEFR